MMRRTQKRITLCLVFTGLLLLFIWGNSCLPGRVSGAFSDWVKEILCRLLRLPIDETLSGSGLLRKLAHFTEFACLGVCLCWLFSMLGKKVHIPFLCGFLVACTDETIQCFIPDRGPAVKDVLIDTAGVAVGILLLLAGHAMYKKSNKMQYLEETKQ